MQHGARSCFAATQGGLSRGIPTGYAASPLNEQIRPGNDPPPVWPCKKGTARGIAFHPLYPSVPEAAERHPALGELLALVELKAGQVDTVDWRKDPDHPAQDPQPPEPNKLRPAVEVQDSELFDPAYPTVLVVPMTGDPDLPSPT